MRSIDTERLKTNGDRIRWVDLVNSENSHWLRTLDSRNHDTCIPVQSHFCTSSVSAYRVPLDIFSEFFEYRRRKKVPIKVISLSANEFRDRFSSRERVFNDEDKNNTAYAVSIQAIHDKPATTLILISHSLHQSMKSAGILGHFQSRDPRPPLNWDYDQTKSDLPEFQLDDGVLKKGKFKKSSSYLRAETSEGRIVFIEDRRIMAVSPDLARRLEMRYGPSPICREQMGCKELGGLNGRLEESIENGDSFLEIIKKKSGDPQFTLVAGHLSEFLILNEDRKVLCVQDPESIKFRFELNGYLRTSFSETAQLLVTPVEEAYTAPECANIAKGQAALIERALRSLKANRARLHIMGHPYRVKNYEHTRAIKSDGKKMVVNISVPFNGILMPDNSFTDVEFGNDTQNPFFDLSSVTCHSMILKINGTQFQLERL